MVVAPVPHQHADALTCCAAKWEYDGNHRSASSKQHPVSSSQYAAVRDHAWCAARGQSVISNAWRGIVPATQGSSVVVVVMMVVAVVAAVVVRGEGYGREGERERTRKRDASHAPKGLPPGASGRRCRQACVCGAIDPPPPPSRISGLHCPGCSCWVKGSTLHCVGGPCDAWGGGACNGKGGFVDTNTDAVVSHPAATCRALVSRSTRASQAHELRKHMSTGAQRFSTPRGAARERTTLTTVLRLSHGIQGSGMSRAPTPASASAWIGRGGKSVSRPSCLPR